VTPQNEVKSQVTSKGIGDKALSGNGKLIEK
jgi:hypothetical protein